MRASPDHLPARAANLVAAGDPASLYEFVRDEIVTYPPRVDSLTASDTTIRWGTRATLRGGAGTPREKADLLADLLLQAGFEAEVWAGPPDGGFDPKQMFSVRAEREFAPPVDAALIDRWLGALSINEVAARPRLDTNQAVSQEIASALLANLPDDLAAPPFNWAVPSSIPFVRLIVDGEERFANPNVPGGEFGVSYTERGSRSLSSVGLGSVEVAVLTTNTNDPSVRTVVAVGQWKVDELVGRRVTARFLPAGDPLASLLVSAETVGTFTTVLTLDAPDVDLDQLSERSVVGSTVTLGGDVLVVDETGTLVMNGEPFGADPTSSPVASLEATVNPSGFPTVRITALANDAAGQPILGIPAEAFRLEENGVPVPFQLRQTRPPRPKVLLLLDTSDSLPPEFVGAEAGRLAGAVAADVLDSFPEAEFRIGTVLAGRVGGTNRWLTDPAEIESEAARAMGHASEIWSAVGDVRFTGANVVVLITDGQSTDTPEQIAAARPLIGSGPATICLGVGEADMGQLTDLALLSGGAAFPIAAQDEAVSAIGSFLVGRQQTPLLFEYQAPEDGPTSRSLRLSASGVEVTVSYDVPAPVDRLPPVALAGIYLRVRLVGGQGGEVLRTIAGIPHEGVTKISEVTPEMRAEVKEAVLGVATLTVEGAAPTLAAWLDDMLTAKLTLRPLVAAMVADDGLAFIDALAEARNIPTSSLALHPPLVQGTDLTFEIGPRFVLLTSRPVFGVGTLRRADILALTSFATAGDDPVSAFRQTVVATARLAAVESAMFSDSTVARLSGRALSYLRPLSGLPLQGTLLPVARMVNTYSDRHRLHPDDVDGFAFWAVDENGTVLGILPDGTGGGASLEAIADECAKTGRKAAVLQLADLGYGLPYAAVVSLQKAISTQILRYAAVVLTIENPEVPEECGGLGDLGCDLVKDTLSEISDLYKVIDTFDDIAEASGAGGLVPCP